MKTILHLFPLLINQHLGKTHGIIPEYFCANYGYKGIIVCSDSDSSFYQYFNCRYKETICAGKERVFPNRELITPHLRILQFKQRDSYNYARSLFFSYKFLFWFLKNARKINIFYGYHFRSENKFLCFLYKLINPKGKTLIKLNSNAPSVQSHITAPKIRKFINNLALRFIDCLWVESSVNYSLFSKAYPKTKCRIINLPNPINDSLLQNMGFANIGKKDKENVIITVARIGAYSKNNEMMLEVLSGLDVSLWKFVFIGSIEPDFLPKIETFYSQNPKLKENVIFTGEITDKIKLGEWYKKAKVFCLTSISEENSNAQTDALYFGCFLVSTPVGGLEEIGNKGQFAAIINNASELRSVLQKIFSGELDPLKYMEEIQEHSKNFCLERVCEKLIEVLDCDR